MVTDHFQAHQTPLIQMVVASEPRLKDPVPPAKHSRDDCSEEECSDEEEIPHPLAEQVAAQLLPSIPSPGAIASTSTTTLVLNIHTLSFHLMPYPSSLLDVL